MTHAEILTQRRHVRTLLRDYEAAARYERLPRLWHRLRELGRMDLGRPHRRRNRIKGC
jgi:hypothetical protein